MVSARKVLAEFNKDKKLLSWSVGNPLFVYGNGKLVRKNDLIEWMRKKLLVIGCQPLRYAGHSFRIGGATELGARCVPSFIIKEMGRWKGPSYKRYIRMSKRQLAQNITDIWHDKKVQQILVWDETDF